MLEVDRKKYEKIFHKNEKNKHVFLFNNFDFLTILNVELTTFSTLHLMLANLFNFSKLKLHEMFKKYCTIEFNY